MRNGKTLGQIAAAHGKTLADVKAAVKKTATARIDADLKAGRITQAQHDEEVADLNSEIAHLGDFDRFGHDGPHGHFGPPPSGTATP